MLLHMIKGPTSFQEIKTIDGRVSQTYREVCLKLGMLENDKQWENALAEASKMSCSPNTKSICHTFDKVCTF